MAGLETQRENKRLRRSENTIANVSEVGRKWRGGEVAEEAIFKLRHQGTLTAPRASPERITIKIILESTHGHEASPTVYRTTQHGLGKQNQTAQFSHVSLTQEARYL